MNIPKKILTLLLIVSPVSLAFAGSTGESGYSAPTFSDSFEFQATVLGSRVDMKWSRFDSFSDQTLRYYKIVRSATKASPVYPDDGYIHYSSDIWSTTYSDDHPVQGAAYYRICAITEKNSRICSNVVKVVALEAQHEKKGDYVKKEDKKTELSVSMKKQLDTILEGFSKKLQNSNKTDAEKLETIHTVIERLSVLKTKKPTLSVVVAYLEAELKTLALSYQIPGDLDGIFDIR